MESEQIWNESHHTTSSTILETIPENFLGYFLSYFFYMAGVILVPVPMIGGSNLLDMIGIPP
ncbi:hypothetical protein DLD82_12185 [Methanospirillum stamsii]|uniref:Uncharacterized protein n=1 Tax=Methanospirillum stamsii TaxID=1277351 RepID=A0A2V2N898_9EURY|nr:hypothetical protein DLD82_12185 [Methanospirillum stamsii]